MSSPYTNPSVKRGATLDTYFVVDGRSASLRSLWERGILEPKERLVLQGQPPFQYSVTIYEANFLDRNRSLLITPETYDFMGGIRDNDADASNELSEDELREVQRAHLPAKQEEKETFWYGVDDSASNDDPATLYDLEVEVEELVEEEA